MKYALRRTLRRIADLATRSGVLRASTKWPAFSYTAFTMVQDLRRQGIRPRSVIDVGANIGQFSIACLELLEPDCVLSFEPSRECFEKLRKNTRRYSNIRIYRIALGAVAEERILYVNSVHQASSLLSLAEEHRASFPAATEVSEELVEVRPLDAIVDLLELPTPRLLKLDVQGFEAEVLRGAHRCLDGIDMVLAECSFKPLYVGEGRWEVLRRRLEARGFEFSRPIDFLQDEKTGEILQMDALFLRSREGEDGGPG